MDPEAAYYQTVEEVFVSQRGDPLFLSNPDWLLVRQWRQQGIPLRIVLRGIRDALDAHAHSWGRRRKVKGLAYCQAEVEAAFERWRMAVGGEAPPDRSHVLLDFAERLEGATTLGSSGRSLALSLAAALRKKAAAAGGLRDLEPWLQAQETELVDRLRQDLGAAAVVAMATAVDAVLAPYQPRMPKKVLDSIRAESLARRLLEAHGLPRLSLFHAGV